jgi:ribosomal protein S18
MLLPRNAVVAVTALRMLAFVRKPATERAEEGDDAGHYERPSKYRWLLASRSRSQASRTTRVSAACSRRLSAAISSARTASITVSPTMRWGRRLGVGAVKIAGPRVKLIRTGYGIELATVESHRQRSMRARGSGHVIHALIRCI